MTLIADAVEPLAACRSRYVANLALLYATDAALARAVEAVPFRVLPRLERTRDGRFTFQTAGDNGRTVYVHSRYAVAEEVGELVRSRPRTDGVSDAAGREPDDLETPCFFVSGLGLGYVVGELERRFRRPVVVVAEDDLRVVKAALCVTDFSPLLRERRLVILTAPDKAAVHARLGPLTATLMLDLRLIALPHTARCRAAFHVAMRALLRDFVAYSRVQMVSLVRNARLTNQNVALNLWAYLRHPGVEVIEGRARGYPAILVAAGPSLARNIDQLAALRGRAVIIGVQTVLKALRARGAPPHFVTSIDYHAISAQFFEGLEDVGDTILVFDPKVTWHVPDAYRGRMLGLYADFANEVLRGAAPRRGPLRGASTVAHLSFYLAEHLGCDPIILVGQDLSFSEGLYYPPGMQIECIWQPELGRFQTVEMKQWERIVRGRAGLKKVRDVHGREVYADDQMLTYAEQFQADFARTTARVIQACEGGRRFEGVETMTLRAAAERFCTRALPAELFAVDAGVGAGGVEKDRCCAELDARRTELAEIRAIADETRRLLDRLEACVEAPAEFNRLIPRVDELRSRMHRHERTYALVRKVAQHAELRRVQADRGLRDEERETVATARRRLRRDREYVAALIEGCDFLLEILPEALQRVRERV